MGKLLRVCGATLQPYPGTEGVRSRRARSGAIGVSLRLIIWGIIELPRYNIWREMQHEKENQESDKNNQASAVEGTDRNQEW